MNQRSRITGHTAPTTTSDLDINEALRRTATVPAPRRLIAAGVKYGNGRLVIQAVTA
ncbi:hypothetical protein [Streptomyces sp. NBC_01240]|uniref:hypothetical protein n=1 Tax=Streptomyces sp. NBC_01240 TaxID=2903793 RepID=UPI002E0DAC7D|nr:hypothetical protein OG466_40920 [Streptomyces sp. NBC_01240]